MPRRGPRMLDLSAESLRNFPRHDVQAGPIERIVEADAGGVIGGVRMRRVKISEYREGRRPPGIVNGIEVIGCGLPRWRARAK